MRMRMHMCRSGSTSRRSSRRPRQSKIAAFARCRSSERHGVDSPVDAGPKGRVDGDHWAGIAIAIA